MTVRTRRAETLDVRGAAAALVGIDDHGVQPRIAGGRFEFLRQRGEKAAERCADVDADNRIVRSRHADVGQISGPFRQDPLVGGLHVRMRTDHGRDAAVEMPPHGNFLRRRLGVEIHEDDPCALVHRVNLARDGDERVVDAQHEYAAHDVDDADALSGAGPGDVAAVPGCAGGVVRRPKEPGLRADVVEGFALVPDVVARRHDVNAVIEQLIADLACDAEPGRGVFRVRNHEVDLVVLDDRLEPILDKVAPGAADDVANEEDPDHRYG